MRKVILLSSLAILGFGVSAHAQEYPQAEVFGAFSVYNVESENMLGWQAAGAANVSESLGLVADFGGQYEDGFSVHQMMFGPRYRTPMNGLRGFAHGLAGLQRTAAANTSAHHFALGIGGGVDYIARNGFGVRLLQLDWLPTRIAGEWTSRPVRYGFGVLIPIN